MAEKDTASRKWQLTFNNPQEHGWTHEKIREVLRTFKIMCYWCMADEIGAGEHTPHTHLFINLAPSNCRFSTLRSKFPGAHIEKVLGTSRENRDYILITNVPPDSQYMNIDEESRKAFYRRIRRVVRFGDDGRLTDYPGVEAYQNATRWTKDADSAAALDASQLSL